MDFSFHTFSVHYFKFQRLLLFIYMYTGSGWLSFLQVSLQGPHSWRARNGPTDSAGYDHSLRLLGRGSHPEHSARRGL